MTWYSILAIIILVGFLIINTGLAIANMRLAKLLIEIVIEKSGIKEDVKVKNNDWFNGFCGNLTPFKNLRTFFDLLEQIAVALDDSNYQ